MRTTPTRWQSYKNLSDEPESWTKQSPHRGVRQRSNPTCLVRYAQTCDTPGKMLRSVGNDDADADADLVENKGIQHDQAMYAAELGSQMIEKKAKRDAAKSGKPKAPPKKAAKA